MPTLVAVVGETGLGRTGGEQYDARLLAMAKQAGCDVSYITWQGRCLDRFMGLPLLWRLRFITRTLSLTWQLCRSSGDVFIDVWLAPYVSFWAKRTSRRIILMVHHLRGELEKDASVQLAERVLIQAASEILTVSQSSCSQIKALAALDTTVSIIPPGFIRPQIQATAKKQGDKVHLLFVGHLTEAKGVLDLLQAVALLPQEPGWFLHVVGGGSDIATRAKATALICDHGLSAQVRMHGRVTGEQLHDLYRQADIFVLPSYWEGYGIVFLEAMSFGLPVVSTDAGAIPEVVLHGQSGLLVEAGNIQDLSAAMSSLIDSPDMRKDMGEHASQAAKQAADWEAIELRFLSWWKLRVNNVC